MLSKASIGIAAKPSRRKPRRHEPSACGAENPSVEREFFMLDGISATENDQLQRLANSEGKRLFKRRIKNPDTTLKTLLLALHHAGWVYINAEFCAGDILIEARIGAKRRRMLARNRLLNDDDCLLGDLVRAAREAGLKPGIEDVSLQAHGQKLLGCVRCVPFSVMETALDRILETRRGPRR